MRIASYNILAPELLIRFWRDSYHLPLLADNSQYDQVNFQRINNVVNVLRGLNLDVLCLQEISTNNEPGINMPFHYYIAQQLGMTVAGESFKNSGFRYNYPPNEKQQKLSVDTGVCILTRAPYQLVNAFNAESTGPSTLFGKNSSPFVTGEIVSPSDVIALSTVHIRIKDGHVLAAIQEYLAKNSGVDFARGVIMGDFNSSVAPQDLAQTSLFTFIHPMPATGDDQMFIGYDLNGRSFVTSEPLLRTNADTTQAVANWNLVQQAQATSDHPCLILDL